MSHQPKAPEEALPLALSLIMLMVVVAIEGIALGAIAVVALWLLLSFA